MYNKRRKFDPRYLLILIIVIIALILVVLAFALRKDRNLSPIEKIGKDTSTMILKVVGAPFDFVKTKLTEIKEKDN